MICYIIFFLIFNVKEKDNDFDLILLRNYGDQIQSI